MPDTTALNFVDTPAAPCKSVFVVLLPAAFLVRLDNLQVQSSIAKDVLEYVFHQAGTRPG